MDKLALMLSYEINPSSGPVVVQRILCIRPAVYDKRGSCKQPDELKERYFVWQICLVPKGKEAYIRMQPHGVYIPGFGYGPTAGKVVSRKAFDTIFDSYAGLQNLLRKPLTGDKLDKLMQESAFRAALEEVFETAGIGHDFTAQPVPERLPAQASTARTGRMIRDYNNQNSYYLPERASGDA